MMTWESSDSELGDAGSEHRCLGAVDFQVTTQNMLDDLIFSGASAVPAVLPLNCDQ